MSTQRGGGDNSNRSDEPLTRHEDADIARVLSAVGARREIPDGLKQRWENTFRDALQEQLDRRQRARRQRVMGLCACMLVAILGLYLGTSPSTKSSITLEVVAARGKVLGDAGSGEGLLRPSDSLQMGSTIATGEAGFAVLNYRGYNLRLNSNTQLLLGAETIRLLTGELYMSDEARATEIPAVQIATPQGSVRDIGTQFSVSLVGERTVAMVRRGAIVVEAGARSIQVDSNRDGPSRVTLGAGHAPEIESVPASGEMWRWIYRGTEPLSLEGKTADAFLRWSVRESGLELRYASQAAEIYAKTVYLHGNIETISPEEAVYPVLATTDLTARQAEDETLLVSLERHD